jgi:hypothetical protein
VNPVFTQAGFRSLRLAWALLAISITIAAVLAYASHWYLERERIDGISSDRKLRDAQSRVEAAKRERDDLQASSVIFAELVDRGFLQEEKRLEFVERLEQLRGQYRLEGLQYDISPQRPLALAGSRVFNTVDVLASRVKLRVVALHEGDLLGFMNAVDRPAKGFQHIVRCDLRRLEAAIDSAAPHVEGECLLDWVSMREKRGANAK